MTNFKQKFWQVVHNMVAHPLLVFEGDWATNFHDWTARKAWPK